jgi:hypothetical protein
VGIAASAQGEESRGGEIAAMSGGGMMKPWWMPSLRPYRVVVDSIKKKRVLALDFVLPHGGALCGGADDP